MKVRKLLFLFIFAITNISAALANQSPEGYWTTMDDNTGKKRALVYLSIQNNVLGGVIEKVYPQAGDTGICSKCPGEFKDKPTKGLKFVWGLKEKSPSSWEDGYILDGKTGKIYRLKLTVKGNQLYVRGYVGVAMLGRTQVWLKSTSTGEIEKTE